MFPKFSLLGLLIFFLNFAPSLLSNEPEKRNLDFSPSDVVKWAPISGISYEDGTIVVKVFLETRENFGLYDNKLKVFNHIDALYSKMLPPISSSIKDPMSGEKVLVYEEGEFTFVFQGFAPYQKKTFDFELQYTGCSGRICLFPYKEKISVPNQFTREKVPENIAQLLAFSEKTQKKEKKEAGKKEKEKKIKSHKAKELAEKKKEDSSIFAFNETSFKEKFKKATSLSSYLLFLLFLLLAGVATNLTPCVYPMIPITIRILSKQKSSPLLASSMYALGIMLTYSTLAFVAILSGSMFGTLLANIYVNIFLSLVMFYFGLSMLGYGDYSFLQKLGHKFSSKGQGLKTAFIMGLGAGLLASPCTGPILGSLLAYSATTAQNPSSIIIYFLVYSFGFSLPYILLGKAASQLSKIQFRSSVQQITKTVFSAVMFGLFFYYLRIPFYSFYKSIKDLWFEIFFLSFFLGTLMSFSSQKGLLKVLSTLIIGLSFFSLFQNFSSSTEKTKIPWLIDEEKAIALAQKEQKPILIDMWAEWCEVCKKMDKETFNNPKVLERIKRNDWVLLKLDLTEETKKNESIYQRYKLIGLPTLVILPDGTLETKVTLRGKTTASKLIESLDQYSKE